MNGEEASEEGRYVGDSFGFVIHKQRVQKSLQTSQFLVDVLLLLGSQSISFLR